MANKKYQDWDSIVIHLTREDKSVTSIQMYRQNLEAMAEDYQQPRKDVLELLIAALEEELKNKNKTIN